MSDKRRVKRGKVKGLLGIFGGNTKEEVNKDQKQNDPIEEKNLLTEDISLSRDTTDIIDDDSYNSKNLIRVITPIKNDSEKPHTNDSTTSNLGDKDININDSNIDTPDYEKEIKEKDITTYNHDKSISDIMSYKRKIDKRIKNSKGSVFPKEKIREVLDSEDVYSLPKIGTKNDTWKHFSTRIHPIIFDMIYNLHEQTGEPVENLISEALLQFFKKVKPSLLMPLKNKKKGCLEIYQNEKE